MTRAVPDFVPHPGQPFALGDDLVLVLAPNPSAMTGPGTNTYVLGRDRLVVIDPGPADPAHLAALLQVVAGRAVDYILITHSHLDHSALAPQLRAQTGATVCAFGDSRVGRSTIMTDFAAQGDPGGGEGIDHSFCPDVTLPDGAVLQGSWGQISALHTPGHMGNHMCYIWNHSLFCGDHVMGWASSVVSPPDGDLDDFLASCETLRHLPAMPFYPGHGAPLHDAKARLDWLVMHRRQRTAQIIAALEKGPATAARLTHMVYGPMDPPLASAAQRNVLAHLVALSHQGLVTASPVLGAGALYALSSVRKL